MADGSDGSGKIVAQIAPTLLGEEDLQRIYNWVDEIQMSRPKKNISRDFSDGVLFAEIIVAFFPRLIEMHNFSAANAVSTKMYNWNTMNQKVLRKLGYQMHPQDIDDVVKATPGAIERVLRVLQEKIMMAQRNGLPRGPPQQQGDGVAERLERRGMERQAARDNRSAGQNIARPESENPSPEAQQFYSQDQAPPRSAASQRQKAQQEVDVELLAEKEQKIGELTDMVDIMSEKIKKLEQLVRIKDSKIDALTKKMEKHGVI